MNTLVRSDEFATLIIIRNPFNPKDNERETILLSKKITLADLLPKDIGEYVVSVNGEIAPCSDWETRTVLRDDYIVLCPVPQGGEEGSKGMLRIIALIAVAYFAPMGLAQLGLEGAALNAVSMLTIAGGSALINHLIPVKPSVPKVEQDLGSSQSYGIDGPKNTSAEGIVLPVVYGRYRVGGNIVNLFLRNVENQTQDLYMQIAVSEGPIEGIETDSILINDQSIEDYQNQEVKVGLGLLDQVSSDWFEDTTNPTSVALTLSTTYQTRTTVTTVDKFRVDLVAASGFRSIDDMGKSWPIYEELSIEYRLLGETDWTALNATSRTVGFEPLYFFTRDFSSDAIYNKPRKSPLVSGQLLHPDLPMDEAFWQQDDPNAGLYGEIHKLTVLPDNRIKLKYLSSSLDVYEGIVGYAQQVPIYSDPPSMRGSHRTAYRVSFVSPTLPQGRYEIRVKRVNDENPSDRYIDTIQWSDLNEIQNEEIGMIGTAWLGLKIRLDDQLNSIPKVTTIINGVIVKKYVFDEDTTSYVEEWEASNNPAWIAYDVMTNTRYGGGIPESRLDLTTWVSWAKHCEDNDLTFDGIFDSDLNIWDALQVVFRAGHAQIINIGTRYSVAIERASTPVMMFNVGNIIEKTFSMSWLPISDRANEIEVTYFDEDDNFLPHTLRVSNKDIPGLGTRRTAELKLYGVTNADKAVKEAEIMLNINRYVLTTVSFEAPIEAIACTIGDLIYVQHDIPQWSFGGRLEDDSTGTSSGFKLDKSVELEAGKNYSLLLTYDVVSRGSQTVDAIISNRYVRLSGSIPAEPIKRAVIGTEEFSVVSTFVDTSGEGIYVDRDVAGGLVGATCTLYDTDVIESRPLTTVTVGGAGFYDTLSVDTPFSSAASKHTKYIFGETEKAKKIFRVNNISGGSELTRNISAVEYNDAVYSDSGSVVTAPNYSSLPKFIAHATNLQVFQESRVIGSVFAAVIIVTWDKPEDDRYSGAEIAVRELNGLWKIVGNATRGATQFEYFEAEAGQNLEFRVIVRDSLGQYAQASGAPTETILVGQIGPTLDAPSNLTVVGKRTSVEVTWQNPSDSPSYASTQVYRGTVDNFSDPSVTLIHTTNGESYTDSTITPETQYFYWVKSVSTEGVISDANNASGATLSAPNAPQGLVVTNSFEGSSASIEWSAQSDSLRYVVEIVTNSVLRRVNSQIHTSYSYGISEMTVDGHINRSIEFNVKVVNIMGQTSTAATVVATNTAPLLPSAISLDAGFQLIRISYDIPTDPDYKETRIWMSQTSGFTPSDANLAARAYGGPIVIQNLQANQTYYVRIATYDTFGQGAMSGEWAETTLDLDSPNLGPWATVTNADRAFIDANLANDSIDSTKIDKLVASKIVAGTIAATEAVSVEGTIESTVGPYTVTLGPKTINSKAALFSFTSGSTPILAVYEDGTAEYTGKITISNGSQGYTNFADRPTSLAGINSSESSKLSGIQAGATVGAVWGSNISGQPSNSQIFNSNISVNANGQLVGAGGGQVTISGLGYTGDLNATNGAVWGTNVSNIPTNLSTLVGSETIKNSLITISANGTLSGAGGGQVTVSGIGAETPSGAQAKATAAENAAKAYADANFALQISLTNVQEQLDGKIDTWYYTVAPTLANAPASTWTNDATKDLHVGDLYFNTVTKIAYRFKKTAPSTYVWEQQAAGGIADALLNASKAQDTADNKRRVFVTTPSGPYEIGDLWDNGSSILRATANRVSGYSASEWVNRANYTTNTNQLTDGAGLGNTATWSGVTGTGRPQDNATVGATWNSNISGVPTNLATLTGSESIKNNLITINANGTLSGAGAGQVTTSGIGAETPSGAQTKATAAENAAKAYVDANFALQTTLNSNITDLKNQIDGKIDTWFYNVNPTLSNPPASTWTNDTTRDSHIGDLYLNRDNNTAYRFIKTGSVYSWDLQPEGGIANALLQAKNAQDTADNKRRVFTATPSGPYDAGDLWVTGSTVARALQARASGYSAGDWSNVANYTTTSSQLIDDAGWGQTADWGQVTGSGKPQNNATVGATWGSNITGQPSDSRLLNSLIHSDTWTAGTTGADAQYQTYISSSNQSRVSGTNPKGVEDVLWQTVYAGSSALGGFTTPTINIDNTKAYRISCWIKKTGTLTASLVPAVAIRRTDNNTLLSSGGGAINASSLPNDEWCLMVAIVFPHNTTVSTLTGTTAAYVRSTGQKIAGPTEYKFDSATTTLRFHASPISAQSGSSALYYRPRIDLLDGNEPSIQELLGYPNQLTPETTTGLNLTATHLGYYDGSQWQSYMDNTGRFYLNGNASNYLFWNGSTLQIKGDIDATKITSSIAKIGLNAGLTNQGTQSFAVGDYAGETNQGAQSLAIGYLAGRTSQSINSISIGHSAGNDTQSFSSVAIGHFAGNYYQESLCVAIGKDCAKTAQGFESVAVGAFAAENTQGTRSVAIGYYAGNSLQGSNSVAIGNGAGKTSQSDDALAVGLNAGNISQGARGVAMGYAAGASNQSSNSVAIGYAAGNVSQGTNSVAIGYQAGKTSQGQRSVAIGAESIGATYSQGSYSIAIGYGSGTGLANNQGNYSTAIGYYANGAADNTTCIGRNASVNNSAWVNSTSIGLNAAATAAYQFTLGDSSITNLRCNDTSISSLSDARDKTGAVSCPIGLNYICDLEPVEFTWKYRKEHYVDGKPPVKEGKKEIGFLAQNLKEVQDLYDIPSLNSYQLYSEEETQQGIEIIEADQGKLIPVLVKAIQELKAEIDDLKKLINSSSN